MILTRVLLAVLFLGATPLLALEGMMVPVGSGDDPDGAKIRPPAGWKIHTDRPGMAMFMEAPANGKVRYGVPLYQRNITVVMRHGPVPFDKTSQEEFRQYIKQNYKKSGFLNADLQESVMMDLRPGDQAFVMRSSFTYNEFELGQLHLLVPGKEKSWLLTYTDLASRMGDDQPTLLEAWNAMISIHTLGEAPVRYEEYHGMAAAVVGTTGLGLLFWFWRRRQSGGLLTRAMALTGGDGFDEDEASDHGPYDSDHSLLPVREENWHGA